jgi:hypothetical protein
MPFELGVGSVGQTDIDPMSRNADLRVSFIACLFSSSPSLWDHPAIRNANARDNALESD